MKRWCGKMKWILYSILTPEVDKNASHLDRAMKKDFELDRTALTTTTKVPILVAMTQRYTKSLKDRCSKALFQKSTYRGAVVDKYDYICSETTLTKEKLKAWSVNRSSLCSFYGNGSKEIIFYSDPFHSFWVQANAWSLSEIYSFFIGHFAADEK